MLEALMNGLRYALRNITRSWIRSFFTVLSVALAISLYAFLTALTDSYQQQMDTIVQKGDVDIIVQSKFSATPMSSSLSLKQVKNIKMDPRVKSAIGVVIGKIRLPEKKNTVYIFGLEDYPLIAQKLGLTLVQGRYYHVGEKELMMASRLMHVLHYQIGSRMVVKEGLTLTIVGAYDAWISLFNSTIACSIENARKILGRNDKTNMVFLTLHNPAKTDELIRWINHTYPALTAIKSGDLSSHIGIIKNLASLMEIVAMVALMAAVAILINTFLVAVHERVQEIGILGALGWPRSMIVYTLTLEAVIVACTGGILGMAMTAAMLAYIRSAYVSMSFYLPDTLQAHIWGMGLGMSMLVGMLGALAPALHAANKSIAKALKDE